MSNSYDDVMARQRHRLALDYDSFNTVTSSSITTP